MPFRRFVFAFRQDFLGGYRYLDHCGEFLARASAEKMMLPTGDQLPSGGNMEKPEIGLRLEFNSDFLRVSHELPGDDVETFIQHAEYFSRLYRELFSPLGVERNGVALNSFLPFADVKQAERESLAWNMSFHDTVSKTLGMVAEAHTSEFRLASGSRHLRVKIHPATFETVQTIRKNAGSTALPRKQQAIQRQNAGVRRALEESLQHALCVDLDLTEDAPPESSIRPLVEELLEKQARVLKHILPSST
jgi:hypothetical protein